MVKVRGCLDRRSHTTGIALRYLSGELRNDLSNVGLSPLEGPHTNIVRRRESSSVTPVQAPVVNIKATATALPALGNAASKQGAIVFVRPYGMLNVTVHNATGLFGSNFVYDPATKTTVFENTADSFVSVLVEGAKYKTTVVQRSLSPTWEQSFLFTVSDIKQQSDGCFVPRKSVRLEVRSECRSAPLTHADLG